MRVSVVVATYNTGDKLDPLLESLRAQSMPADDFEVVVVDDGSTDGTHDRLLAAAATDPQLRVHQIPNSGWPSRPRNVGTAEARGDYVLYMDHDDQLFPEALERMADLGDANGSDVVIGKEVRSGARTIGPELFRRDLGRADLVDDEVLALITPHKMFRTAFLRDEKIAFPEDRRRLEDHHLLAEVYTRTDAIAVLASHPCYRWIIYPDGSNTSEQLPDPVEYYASLAAVLDVFETAGIDDERRDLLVGHWYATRMLGRLGPAWLGTWDPEQQRRAFDVIRGLAEERVPRRLDAALPPMLARRARLMRDGDLASLVALAEAETGTRLVAEAESFSWAPDGLHLDVVTTFVHRDDAPVGFRRDGARVARVDSFDDGLSWDPTGVRFDVVARRPDLGTEWFQPSDVVLDLVPGADGDLVVRGAGEVVVPFATGAMGAALDDTTWSVVGRARLLGLDSRPHLRVRSGVPSYALVDGRPAIARGDGEGRLRVTIGDGRKLLDHLVPTSASARTGGGRGGVRVSVPLRLDAAEGGPGDWWLDVGGHRLDATLVRDGDRWRVEGAGRLPRGRHEVRVHLGDVASRLVDTVVVRALLPTRSVREPGAARSALRSVTSRLPGRG